MSGKVSDPFSSLGQGKNKTSLAHYELEPVFGNSIAHDSSGIHRLYSVEQS